MKKRMGSLLLSLVLCLLALTAAALAADETVAVHLRTVAASSGQNIAIPQEYLVRMKLAGNGSTAYENESGYYKQDTDGNWIYYGSFKTDPDAGLNAVVEKLRGMYSTSMIRSGLISLPFDSFTWKGLPHDTDWVLKGELHVYQVKFAKNDGTGGCYADKCYAIKNSEANSGLPAVPTREGFTFDGWYTAADGGDRVTAKNLNRLLKANVNTDEATLYAHWTMCQSPHTHCVCGSTHKDIGDHTTKQTVTFTPWSDATALPSVPGNYYLTCNVMIDDTWIPAADTGLCLSGFSIINRDPVSAVYVGDWTEGDGGTFLLGTNQRTFTLTDCKGSGKLTSANDKSNGIHVLGSGTFNLFGGSIADNPDTGVFVSPYSSGDPASNGTFIMYGGSITGNAGGVNLNNSRFTMHGGEISGNHASADGGGVGIWQNGQFDMRGGKIRGNSAKVGGGVCVYGGTFTMKGGEICGNSASSSGGGVYFHSSTFTVSGSVWITDNVTGGTKDPATGLYTGGKASNVYLSTNNSKITIDDKLENESPIGVTLVAGYRDPKIFTSGWSDKMGSEADPAAYFSSDNAAYYVEKDAGGEAKLTAKHSHALCEGQPCSDPTHSGSNHGSDVGFVQALSQGTDNKLYINAAEWTADDAGVGADGLAVMGYRLDGTVAGAKTFYLETDLTLDHPLLIYGGYNASVTLCLNGHTIRVTTNEPAIQFVRSSDYASTLILCDCVGTGMITHNERDSSASPNQDRRIGVEVGGFGRFTMYGGSITGGSTGVVLSAYPAGSGKEGRPGGTFTMYGGEIANNQNDIDRGYGGGVTVGLPSDTGVTNFTMYGGKITGNRVTDGNGGGVAIWQHGQFDMRGGEITGNRAQTGGGVWFFEKTAETKGSFTVSGSARIMDNTKNVQEDGTYEYSGSWPNNVHLGNGCCITIGGELKNESHTGAAIGVTLDGGTRANDPIFTAGWNAKMGESAAPAGYFSSDLAGYTVEKTEDGTEARLVRTAQSIKLDLNSIFKKQLTSNAPFDKLTQTAFTLTLSGGATGVWTLDTTATATITEASMTESGGVYTASVPFVFADDHEQSGEYSLQNGILTVTAPAGQTANLEFDVTEQNDGTAGMTYGTQSSACKFGFELSVDPRTGALIIVPNSMAYTYLGADPVKLTPVLENDGVYRVSGNGVTIQNDFTYTEPEPDDDPGDLIFPILIKQDKGLLNKDDHTAYLTGYPDGTIRPDGKITRAEAAAIFYRLLRADVRRSASASFTDVPAGKWYSDAVATMAGLGIVTGYPDGTFRPDQTITRAEFAAILARIEKDKTGTAVFSDVSGHWAAQQIGVASANGWVTGYADGTFRPDQTITRAEAVAMTNRLLERKPQSASDLIPGMYTWTDNADPAKWYYLDLQEAANSHTYTRKTFGYELWRQLKN